MTKTIALILAAGTLLIAAGCATPQPPKWKYQVVKTLGGVNERAAKGWTVDKVTIKPDGSHEYLLKMQIQ